MIDGRNEILGNHWKDNPFLMDNWEKSINSGRNKFDMLKKNKWDK